MNFSLWPVSGWIGVAAVATWIALIQPCVARTREKRLRQLWLARRCRESKPEQLGEDDPVWAKLTSVIQAEYEIPCYALRPEDSLASLEEIGIDAQDLIEALAEAFAVRLTARDVYGPIFPWKQVPNVKPPNLESLALAIRGFLDRPSGSV